MKDVFSGKTYLTILSVWECNSCGQKMNDLKLTLPPIRNSVKIISPPECNCGRKTFNFISVRSLSPEEADQYLKNTKVVKKQ